MSNYRAQCLEYPLRVWRAWKTSKSTLILHDAEVSTLIAATCAVTGGPLDRLELIKNKSETLGWKPIRHSSNDATTFIAVRSRVREFLDKPFLSEFEARNRSWRLGKLPALGEGNEEPEAWQQELQQAYCLSTTWAVLLRHLRNATAHSNIFTDSEQKNNITTLIMLNNKSREINNPDWWGLIVNTSDLEASMDSWVSFLEDQHIKEFGESCRAIG